MKIAILQQQLEEQEANNNKGMRKEKRGEKGGGEWRGGERRGRQSRRKRKGREGKVKLNQSSGKDVMTRKSKKSR
eukprot:755694-Hanusia_phi.AAC.1